MMKTRHLLMMLLMAAVPLVAGAYDFEADGLYFEKTSEGEVAVVKGPGAYRGDVVIPARVENEGVEYVVTSVGETAFVSCTELTSVEFPSTLRAIGEDAFYACSRLRTVSLPEGLERIGKGVFHYCGMEEIMIPATVSVIEGGFACGYPEMSKDLPAVSLKAVRVADDSPYFYALRDDAGLVEKATGRLVQAVAGDLVVPEGVVAIGGYAFSGAETLSLTLPEGFRELEEHALEGVHDLSMICCCSVDPPVVSSRSFASSSRDAVRVRSGCTLYVPTGSLQAYQSAGWNGFKNAVEYDLGSPGDPTAIGSATVAETEEGVWFSADGKSLQAPQRGLNIVRKGTGPAAKVLQK